MQAYIAPLLAKRALVEGELVRCPMAARAKTKFRSRIGEAVHETASGLHRIGLIDQKTMRAFDATCLTTIQRIKRGIPRGSWLPPEKR